MKIAAIMPCRGRAEQTIENVQRLVDTAGLGWDEWELTLIVDNDTVTLRALITGSHAQAAVDTLGTEQRGYWHALQAATKRTDATHIVNLANDLLPGYYWLERAKQAYIARFGNGGDGLMGFNDGIHGPEHSPHFLISRRLLEHYGGWPVWYQHNYGDTELCQRAQQDGRYAKAAWAVLYHNHVLTGNSADAVYQEGDETRRRDRRLFNQRKARGWPPIS